MFPKQYLRQSTSSTHPVMWDHSGTNHSLGNGYCRPLNEAGSTVIAMPYMQDVSLWSWWLVVPKYVTSNVQCSCVDWYKYPTNLLAEFCVIIILLTSKAIQPTDKSLQDRHQHHRTRRAITQYSQPIMAKVSAGISKHRPISIDVYSLHNLC